MKLTDKTAGRGLLVVLITAAIVLFTLTYNSFGVEYPIRYEQNVELDSLRIIYMQLPVEASGDTLFDSTTGAANYFDTTWIVTSGQNHRWLYIPFFPGSDSGGPTTQFSRRGMYPSYYLQKTSLTLTSL